MKKIITIFMLVCLVGSMMVGCGSSEAAFKTFTSEDSSFSIDFPGEPKVETQTIDTQAGEMKIEFFMVEEKNVAYNVARNTMPDAVLSQDPDVVMTNGCNGAVANTGGTNANIEDITIAGHAGKYVTYDINAEGRTLKAHQQVVLIDNVMYQTSVISDEDDKYKENREKFFNSFKVTK
ncbi:MAG: hypothetical protein N4A57_15080 [Anaeromicrobium sp.]|jgi:hypothetical protein|uniref:hypothetical protein n=1 Tax=Anaeromicrobium sp. TaxID=1929132 RepID=UPI0025E473CE|nr:hypothetical protein [Anaeromicrobium sp.]MCT4595570.1 hypothetical protein [Anaeromicrobium sp.]